MFVWHAASPTLKRCRWAIRRQLTVTDVALSVNSIAIVTEEGEAFVGNFVPKKSSKENTQTLKGKILQRAAIIVHSVCVYMELCYVLAYFIIVTWMCLEWEMGRYCMYMFYVWAKVFLKLLFCFDYKMLDFELRLIVSYRAWIGRLWVTVDWPAAEGWSGGRHASSTSRDPSQHANLHGPQRTKLLCPSVPTQLLVKLPLSQYRIETLRSDIFLFIFY